MRTEDYKDIFKGYEYVGMDIPAEKWMQTDMTDHMKKVFTYLFESSKLLFNIRVANTELLVIEINVKTISDKQSEFSGVIHRAMPYPILLIENYKNEVYRISITDAHTNKNNSYREVVDRRSESRWVNSITCYALLLLLNGAIQDQNDRKELFYIMRDVIERFYYLHIEDISEEKEKYEKLLEEINYSNDHIERVNFLLEMLKIANGLIIDFDEDDIGDEVQLEKHFCLLGEFIDSMEESLEEMSFHTYGVSRYEEDFDIIKARRAFDNENEDIDCIEESDESYYADGYKYACELYAKKARVEEYKSVVDEAFSQINSALHEYNRKIEEADLSDYCNKYEKETMILLEELLRENDQSY